MADVVYESPRSTYFHAILPAFLNPHLHSVTSHCCGGNHKLLSILMAIPEYQCNPGPPMVEIRSKSVNERRSNGLWK
jgi:hypothetical protein